MGSTARLGCCPPPPRKILAPSKFARNMSLPPLQKMYLSGYTSNCLPLGNGLYKSSINLFNKFTNKKILSCAPKNRLPLEFYNRKKTGFSIPVIYWFKKLYSQKEIYTKANSSDRAEYMQFIAKEYDKSIA